MRVEGKGRSADADAEASDAGHMVAVMMVAGQAIGIPIDSISEVFVPDRVTRVPLSPGFCSGLVNLRGRIVPIVSVRKLLGLSDDMGGDRADTICVNVGQGEETVGLLVDVVDEIVTVQPNDIESCPATMPAQLRAVARGIVKMEGTLLLLIDLGVMLDWTRALKNDAAALDAAGRAAQVSAFSPARSAAIH